MKVRQIEIAVGATVLAMVFVAGCGKKEEQKKVATQVVAKVDSEEISVHQLNAALSRLQGVPQDKIGQVKWEVLGKLVEQQLAVNKALEKKLDRKPEILMAVEGARRDILARAYLQELAAGQVKPTEEEVRAYFNDHPELFSERRVYRLQEIALQKDDPSLPAIKTKVAASKSMEEIATWLNKENIPFKANAGIRAAEQLPMEVVSKVHTLKNGEIALFPTNEGSVIVRVTGSETQSVNEAQAMPKIQAYLSNQRTSETVQREIKSLKEKAKIEYLGDFAGGVPPKPAEPTPPPPKPVVPPKRIEPPPPPKPAAPVDNKLIEKGVSGLK